jgi:hypothetical protein
MNTPDSEIERLHDLIGQSINMLGEAGRIVSNLEATTDSHAESKSKAIKLIGDAIGNAFYAQTFLPADVREEDEVPGEPDTVPSPEEQERLDHLSEEQIQIIDDALMANVSSQWRKMARVIGSAMETNSDLIQNVPDVIYAHRLRLLVDEGKLESQGNLDYMRFGEVRLPTIQRE